MSALGSLVVKLALEYAEYTKGLDKSSQDGLKFAQDTQKHFDRANAVTHEFFTGVVKGAATAAAAYIGVSSAVDMFNESIDNLASLDDMSQKTGATVENLSRLQKVAVMTGTEFSLVDGSVTKLAKNMANIDGSSNKTQQALDKLGVSSRDAAGQLRDPAEVLIDVAKGMQNYEDGAGKVAVANDLFGKSGAELLPYLNDVVENVDKFTGVSGEAAKKASEMQDRFGELKVRADELKTEFSVSLLPVINDITKAIVDTYQESGKLEAAWVALGGLGSFLFTDEFDSDKKKLADLNKELEDLVLDQKLREESFGLNGSLKRLLFGGYSLDELPKAIEYTRYQIGLLQEKIKNDAAPKSSGKPQVDLDDIREKEEREREAKARAERLQREYESQEKHRAKFIQGLEKEAATLLMTAAESKVYEAAQIGISGKQLDKVKTLAKSIEAHKANEKAIADDLKVSQEHAAQNLEFSNSLQKNVDALQSQVEAQREYNNRLGLTQVEISSLNDAEIERQAIALESRAKLMDQIDLTGQLGDKYREEAKLLRELNALKNEGIDRQEDLDKINRSLKEQSDFWVSLDRTAHDTWISIANGGKDTATRLRETFKNIFFDYIYQMGKSMVVNVVLNASANGSVGGGAVGGTSGFSSLSSLYSAGKSLWDGFSLAGTIGGGIGQLGSLFGSSSISAFASGMSGTAAGTFAGAGPTLAGSASGLGALAGTGGTTGVLSSGAGAGAGAAGAGSSAAAAVPIVGWVLAGMMANNSLFDKGWGDKLDDKAKYSGAAAGMVGGLFTDSLQRIFGLSDKTASMLSGSAVVNRLFGNKRAELQQSEISGSFGANGYAANQRDVYKAEGGLFSGDKWSEKINAAGNNSAMNDMFTSIKQAAAGYASQLGLSTKALETFSKDFKFNLSITGDAAKDAAANEKLFNDLVTGVTDDISKLLLPSLDQFKAEGESAYVTFARVAGTFATVNSGLSGLGLKLFEVGEEGIKASEKFTAAVGGLQSFQAAQASFYQNFFSEEERNNELKKQLTAELQKQNLALPESRKGYRALLEEVSKTGTPEQLASLFKLNAAFANLYPMINESTTSAQDAMLAMQNHAYSLEKETTATVAATQANEAAARSYESLVNSLSKSAETALQIMRNSVTLAQKQAQDSTAETIEKIAGQRSVSTSLYDAQKTLLGGAISSAKALGNLLQAEANRIRGFANGMSLVPDADNLGTAQFAAQAGLKAGDVSDYNLKLASSITPDMFATWSDYAINFFDTQKTIAGLATNAEMEASKQYSYTDTLALQLQTVESQFKQDSDYYAAAQKAAESALTSQNKYFESMLQIAQDQLAEAQGTKLATMSLQASLANYSASVGVLSATTGNKISTAFPSSIIASSAPILSMPTVSSNGGNAEIVTALKELRDELILLRTTGVESKDATQKVAELLDRVTAGGNAMMTETA